MAKLLYNLLFVACSPLLLLLLLHFPTNAVSQYRVQHLPGLDLDGPLPFEFETGYVNVDESNGVELFYYYFKSENIPSEDPLVFWFTGGPGCSGLSAILFEVGPFVLRVEEYNGSLPALDLNPYAWTKVANMVILDSPVGTGFSYSTTSQGYETGDTKSAQHAYTFVKKWLISHSEFLSNPLYIGGLSYAGKHVPVIVQYISDGIKSGDKPLINLKGYLLGNPLTDRSLELNSVVKFTYGMGIISDELFQSAKKNCGEDYVHVNSSNVQCTEDLRDISKCVTGPNDEHILEPFCVELTPEPKERKRYRSSLEENSSNLIILPPPFPEFQCWSYRYTLSYYWTNDDRVQMALNVRKGTIVEWKRCNTIFMHYMQDVEISTTYHSKLSEQHYKSLIFSGDHDMMVPFWSTEAWIKSLNYPINDDWRAWIVDGQIAGYTRKYTNNMIFATVKGAGHTAPEYKRKECQTMFKRWLSYEPL